MTIRRDALTQKGEADAILRRFGPVPFWRGERRVLDQLGEIYRKAVEKAKSVGEK